MKEYKNRRQLLCLVVTVGMMFTAVNVSSKTVWAAEERGIEYDPNQGEKAQPGLEADGCSDRSTGRRKTLHPGSIILKQNLKEEDLPSLKQPEASYTDEMGFITVWRTGRCVSCRKIPGAVCLKKRKCTGR